MERLEKQLAFIHELHKIKNIFRRSVLPDSLRFENDAEHSWHIATMVLILEEYMEADTDILKVLKMTLIHDIVEIYAGDTYCFDEDLNKEKAEREKESAEKIYGMLDDDQKNYFKNLWSEFEEAKTKEAIFANVVDRLEPMLLHVEANGGGWVENGIKKHQVEKRMQPVLDYGGEIGKYVRNVIDEFAKRGIL